MNLIKSSLVCVAILVTVFLACWSGNANAGDRMETDQEIAMLPAYCKDRIRGCTQAEKQRWIQVLGVKNWSCLHHYCRSIVALNRADLTGDPAIRKKLLLQALHNFKRNTKELTVDFPLRYGVFYRMGETATKLGNTWEAIQAFNTAMKLKPTYWPTYLALSNAYLTVNEREMAMKVIEQGLQEVPESKALQRQKAKIAGSTTP